MHKQTLLYKTGFLIAVLLWSCSLEKKTPLNRRLQNITAHYNILFNARQILQQKQADYADAFIDDYSELLRVYTDTTYTDSADADLAAVTQKAQKIIAYKEQSKYVGDAYFILGQANYLNKQYFNAVEYCNYVLRGFAADADLTQQARVWKARSLLMLNETDLAGAVLDTALKLINPKKHNAAAIYGTRLQYQMDAGNYTGAEQTAATAIKAERNNQQRLRMRFIMAQLQEMNNKPAEAIKNYADVATSNASFEMAFNAQLNRIRIEEITNGAKQDRVTRLAKLLRNDNNADFTDQIYYQIAKLNLANGEYDEALKNLRLSIAGSTQNNTQKGLSYLQLADVLFNIKNDYVDAKKYYDSTLATLPPSYSSYAAIRNKTDNLQQLSTNLTIIAREDTLQMLARLPEDARSQKLDELTEAFTAKQTVTSASKQKNNGSYGGITKTDDRPAANTGSNFYFYNNAAVSSGIVSFKQRWGNRKLEDNWRRSRRAEANITANTTAAPPANMVSAEIAQTQSNSSAEDYRKQLEDAIPLTDVMLKQSNQRIYNALYDIATFYRDVVGDKKEAIIYFEKLANGAAATANTPAIYYSLYRLYTDAGSQQNADVYKKRLLNDYATSIYAHILTDPEYARRITDADAEFNALYNEVYNLYAQRKYAEVMQQVDMLMQQYPANKLAAQLYYLRALAHGHGVKLPPFKTDLENIVNQYPADRLVTPLVGQHLAFIASHQDEMAARTVVLVDSDADYIPFMPDEVAPLVSNFAEKADVRAPLPLPKPSKTDTALTIKNNSQPVILNKQISPDSANSVKDKPIAKNYRFNEADSANYYFVIDVNTLTTNLSSSRFGIGQFNRTRYAGQPIRHQLKAAGSHQLIYVGRFTNITEAKNYARGIVPLLPDIMKVPKDKYTFFISTKQNLDKLADDNTLKEYIEYYQDTF